MGRHEGDVTNVDIEVACHDGSSMKEALALLGSNERWLSDDGEVADLGKCDTANTVTWSILVGDDHRGGSGVVRLAAASTKGRVPDDEEVRLV